MTNDTQPAAMPFVRPNDSLGRRFMNRHLLPPQPDNQIAYDFGNLKQYRSAKLTLLGIGIELAHVVVSLSLIHLWRGFAIAPFTIYLGGMSWLAVHNPSLLIVIVLGLVLALLGLIVWQFARNSGAEWKKLRASARNWFRDECTRWRQRATNRRAVQAAGGDKSVQAPLQHKTRMPTRVIVQREQWLRQGAENWTKKQQLMACCVSSICVIPIMLTSISEFTAHALFAALYMKLYLRGYKKYGNQREAVLHTMLIHRAVNRAIILMLLLNGFIAYINFDLFMSIHGH